MSSPSVRAAVRDEPSSCPGCGGDSTEDYGGTGQCWPCWELAATPGFNGVPSVASGIERGGVEPGHALAFVGGAELHAATPEVPEWLWRDYIAAGSIVALGGKPKAGKSTLACALTEAITSDAGALLGRPVTPGTVVYVSEEAAGTLRHKLPRTDRVRVLTREAAWPKPTWSDLVVGAVQEAVRTDAVLLIIDTFAHWADLGAEREKDAGAVGEAVAALTGVTAHGLAVLLVAHQRKAGGDHGDALRGSNALAGACDVVIELERPDGPNPPPRQRVLAAVGRYPQTPAVLLVDHDAATGGWAVIGEGDDRGASRALGDRIRLLNALPTEAPGLSRAELEDLLDAPHQQWTNVLTGLIADGHATRHGAGKKGDPYRWRKLRTDAAHNPAQHVRSNGSADGSLSGAADVVGTRNETTAAASALSAPCAESDLDRAERLEARWAT